MKLEADTHNLLDENASASAAADVPERVLSILSHKSPISTTRLANELGLEHQQTVGAVKSLEALGDVIRTEPSLTIYWELTNEGQEV
ncbi:unnamed protein product, partial [Soboliphyme baturini]|uniref:PheRS_DBD1 domain-containing protein n=1 Tax=Soboliphyme baturini TaxID=241478 RepID=A0A183IVQ6_9BILA